MVWTISGQSGQWCPKSVQSGQWWPKSARSGQYLFLGIVGLTKACFGYGRSGQYLSWVAEFILGVHKVMTFELQWPLFSNLYTFRVTCLQAICIRVFSDIPDIKCYKEIDVPFLLCSHPSNTEPCISFDALNFFRSDAYRKICENSKIMTLLQSTIIISTICFLSEWMSHCFKQHVT